MMVLQGSYYYLFSVLIISFSLMCQAEAYLTAEEKATLLNEHNLLRSQVNPPAANMEEMVSHMY